MLVPEQVKGSEPIVHPDDGGFKRVTSVNIVPVQSEFFNS
jgi:hypothetical protein